ncbi:lysophospholipid acyltransferase family protein [Halpernia frigidisoli]|uniref:KDO2-lipid IV(A) lauroyltransferase n=1 Tax=Halpernia frigidisoli TaxID=1125876 RepID=A0A1I3EAX8_9FLAO|nr:lysophospholipid acyltransferase family protein [Halpernia frigidisoli]SFH96132.1 KDO2-lipid IV(A) lauroyltransferase [Halpernia frigidisoli]
MKFLFKLILHFSRLPLQILYLFADFLFFVSYYIISYRKKEVTENLKKSFPEKSISEIRKIRKTFYKNFADYIAETVKLFTITETELRVRIQHLNQDLFHQSKKDGKNVILLAGHVFNWEWITVLPVVISQKHCHPVYRKVSNDFWEDKLKFIRNRFGNSALEAKEVIRQILRTPNDGDSVYMFVADQTPHSSEVNFGINFLNQRTPAFIGYDKLATRLDLDFFYCEMKKVKRGFYQVNYYKIFPDGEKFEEFEVVKKFHHRLENTINKRPDNWLWSHRRWKYSDLIKRFEV